MNGGEPYIPRRKGKKKEKEGKKDNKPKEVKPIDIRELMALSFIACPVCGYTHPAQDCGHTVADGLIYIPEYVCSIRGKKFSFTTFLREIMKALYPPCPNCFSVNVVRDGHINGKQRYRCKDCGTVFIPRGKKSKEVRRARTKAVKELWRRVMKLVRKVIKDPRKQSAVLYLLMMAWFELSYEKLYEILVIIKLLGGKS